MRPDVCKLLNIKQKPLNRNAKASVKVPWKQQCGTSATVSMLFLIDLSFSDYFQSRSCWLMTVSWSPASWDTSALEPWRTLWSSAAGLWKKTSDGAKHLHLEERRINFKMKRFPADEVKGEILNLNTPSHTSLQHQHYTDLFKNRLMHKQTVEWRHVYLLKITACLFEAFSQKNWLQISCTHLFRREMSHFGQQTFHFDGKLMTSKGLA